MKMVIYALCMSSAWFGAGAAPGIVIALFQSILGGIGRNLAQVYIFTVSILVGAAIIHRIVKMFISRSFVLPPHFQGIPFFLALLSTLPIVLIVLAYVLVALSGGTAGLSGIPLAILLATFGTLAPIPIIYCEIPDMLTTLRKLPNSLP